MAQRLTRRQFTTGLTAAGLAATLRKTTYGQLGANDKIGVAVCGFRNRGNQVARDLQATGKFDILVVCDPDEAMYDRGMKICHKEKHDMRKLPKDPKFVRDYRDILNDKDIDAIVVATPDHWHAKITLDALEAGKHVYLEKPASYCINDGRAMVAGQKAHSDLTILVGTQQRSGPHFADAQNFIREGNLGTIGFIRPFISIGRHFVPKVPDTDPPASLDYELWTGPAPMQPYNEKRVHYNWHFMRPYGTGDTANWGAHWVDSMRHICDLDLPTEASGRGGIFVVHDAKEFDDTQAVNFNFGEKIVLWTMREWSNGGPNGARMGVEVWGDKGSIHIDRGGWTFYPRSSKEKPVFHKQRGMMHEHALNFADCIHGKAKPNASIEDGHKSTILCHLSNIATKVGRPVKFDPATEMILDDPDAIAMMARPYRDGYHLPDAYRKFEG